METGDIASEWRMLLLLFIAMVERRVETTGRHC
jgi:hypothetical protein